MNMFCLKRMHTVCQTNRVCSHVNQPFGPSSVLGTTGAVGLTCISMTLSSRSRSQGVTSVTLTELEAPPLASILLVHSYLFEGETVYRYMLEEYCLL